MAFTKSTPREVSVTMVDRSTGAPLTTGVTVNVWKDGAAAAAGAGTLTNKTANGTWTYLPTAAEWDGDAIHVEFAHPSGLAQVREAYPDTKLVSDLSDFNPTTAMPYQWDTGTSATDPGAGRVRGNNATYPSITELYINRIDDAGDDRTSDLRNLATGDDVFIANPANTNQYIRAKMTADPAQAASFFTLQVTVTDAGPSGISNNTPVQVALRLNSGLSASEVEDAVWDASQSAHTTPGTFGEHLDTTVSGPNAADVELWRGTQPDALVNGAVPAHVMTVDATAQAALVKQVWDYLASAAVIVGSLGKLIADSLDAVISSRSSHSASDVTTDMDANSTRLADINTDTGRMDALLENVSGDRFTAKALEQAPDSSQVTYVGVVTRAGSTYTVNAWLTVSGAAVVPTNPQVTVYGSDGTAIGYTGVPTVHPTGLIMAAGTLSTTLPDNDPITFTVSADTGGATYDGPFTAVSIA